MTWASQLSSDVRFAVRTMAKRHGFAIIAAFTLALGIGAATAVFSIVYAVLLRPLPYKNFGWLVSVWLTGSREKTLAKLFATHADYLEFRRHARTLESVSAATPCCYRQPDSRACSRSW